MDFTSFLILLAISLAVSGILHFGLEYYVNPGMWSFASKVVVGFIGASYGTSVFGRWPDGGNFGSIYYIPAILGAFAILLVAIDLMKMKSGGSAKRRR